LATPNLIAEVVWTRGVRSQLLSRKKPYVIVTLEVAMFVQVICIRRVPVWLIVDLQLSGRPSSADDRIALAYV